MATTERGGGSRGQLLIVRTRGVRDAFVNVGQRGESRGDFILFEETVRGRNGGRVIGRDSVRGELGLRTFTIECTIHIFRKGKIAIASTVFSERDNAYAVTGGTGAYKGVGGELSAFDLAAGTRCSSSTWLLAGRGRRPLMDGAPVRSGRFPEGIDAGLPLGFVRARE